MSVNHPLCNPPTEETKIGLSVTAPRPTLSETSLLFEKRIVNELEQHASLHSPSFSWNEPPTSERAHLSMDGYTAGPGWDPASRLGTPNGTKLFEALGGAKESIGSGAVKSLNLRTFWIC